MLFSPNAGEASLFMYYQGRLQTLSLSSKVAVNYSQFFQEKKKKQTKTNNNFSKASMKVDVGVHHRLFLPPQIVPLY